MAPKKQFTTIDEYIKTVPKDVQPVVRGIRRAIQKAAPDAVETISYQMPSFKLNGDSWCLSRPGNITSACTRYPQVLLHSKRRYRNTKQQRAPCNSRWINRFHMTC